MIVIGLTGGMGQGKSTVGEMLRELAQVDYKADLESSYPISEVANAWMTQWPRPLVLRPHETLVDLANELIKSLPEVLNQVTGKTASVDALRINGDDQASLQLNNRLLKYIDRLVTLSAQEIAVQFPTPIKPDNKGLHRALLMWIGGGTIETVSRTIWSDLLDQRIKQLAERGYKLVTVGGIRYDHDAAMIHANGGVVLRVIRPHSHESSDVTEVSMKDIKPDIILHNDGSIEQLSLTVQKLWRDLENGQHGAIYHASEQA